jgi:hypothetical protein
VNIIFIVSVIEPVSVLKIEFFSARAEARLNDEVRDLERMFFSARFDNRFRAPLSPLRKDVRSVRPEARVNDAGAVLNMEFFFPRFDAVFNETLRDWVYATLLLRSTAIATQATLFPKHSVFVTELLPVLSNPEVVTLEPVPVEA